MGVHPVCLRAHQTQCAPAMQHYRHDSRGWTTYRNVLYQSTSPKELEKGAPQCPSTKKKIPRTFSGGTVKEQSEADSHLL